MECKGSSSLVFPFVFDNSFEDSVMLADLHLIAAIVIAVVEQPIVADFAVMLNSRANFVNNRFVHHLSTSS
jgi:hypothetical protein